MSRTLREAAVQADPQLPVHLAELLQVAEGSRTSTLDRLCKAQRSSSGKAIVKALQRAEEVARLGAGRVELHDVPANRMKLLARTGLGNKASALARMCGTRR